MLLTALLAFARFAHYTAATALFGAALFPVYAFAGSARVEAGVDRVARRTRLVSALAVLVSGAAWFLVAAANMSGDLAAAFDPAALGFVAAETQFGRVWIVRGLLCIAVAWMAFRRSRRGLDAALAGLLLAGIALTGHTQVESGPAGLVHVSADAVHLLAAGAWLGALIPLLALAWADPVRMRARGLDLGVVLAGFSGVGVTAVAALIASGTVNAWFLVGDPVHLISTTYGRVLCAKLAAFAGMLGLAAANRFWITAALNAALVADQARPWYAALRRHIVAEQILGLLVLALVAALGLLEPGSAGEAAP